MPRLPTGRAARHVEATRLRRHGLASRCRDAKRRRARNRPGIGVAPQTTAPAKPHRSGALGGAAGHDAAIVDAQLAPL
jgi:hypothetical protein